MLGVYFNLLYYIVFPVVIYLIAVGFNAIAQQGTCKGINNITNCFMGATYTLGYLYATMVAVNLIGPNGILTFEPEDVPIKGDNAVQLVAAPPNSGVYAFEPVAAPSASLPLPPKGSDEIPQKSSNEIQKKSSNVANVAKAANVRPNTPGATTDEDPQAGGKRILRQRGGGPSKDKMSDAALMIRSFFTTLRAPAMSLFIRDPNAATLEDVETKSPLYTGIGVGFWACLATISGQVISSSIAQVC